MARHLATVVWHDLTEDPTDLPKESGYGYILSVRYKRSGMRLLLRDVKYDAYERAWVNEDITTGYEYVLCKTAGWNVFDIIAWAEDIKPYRAGGID